jgi:signal transduction histidine kinase
MSPALTSQFTALFSGPEGLDAQMAAFVALAEPAVERALTPAELNALEAMAYGALFSSLDEAVTLFQSDAEAGLAAIAAAHMIQLLVIIVVLVGEALFIFWPLTRKLMTAMAVEIQARQQAEDALRVEASLDASKQRFVSLIQTDFLEPLNRIADHLETMRGGDRAAWPGLRAQASREVDQTRSRISAMVSFFEDWRRNTSADGDEAQSGKAAPGARPQEARDVA